MNFKALLALALAIGAGGPAWGQDYGGNPYAPKPATPYGARNAYSPYGPKSSTDPYGTTNLYNPYDTSAQSGDRSGAYWGGAAPTYDPEYGSINPYRTNPYERSAPAAQQSSAYGGGSTMYGSSSGSERNPYAPTRGPNPVAPKSDPNVDHSAGALDEDAAERLERSDGSSKGLDESLRDPLDATQSDASGGSGLSKDPYAVSPHSLPRSKSSEPKGASGILGFDPFDPMAAARQPGTPAKSATKNNLLGTAASSSSSSSSSASGQASSLGPVSPSLGATVPGGAAR